MKTYQATISQIAAASYDEQAADLIDLARVTLRDNALDDEQMAAIGQKIAEVLQLKPLQGSTPPRYATTWGNKTALGLYNTLRRFIENDHI